MSGLVADFVVFRRAALALGLCGLALLFAVEAKTARYGPVAGAGSDVRAAKALPAEQVERGVRAPGATHLRIASRALAVITCASRRGSLVPASDLVSNRPAVFSVRLFFPSRLYPPSACPLDLFQRKFRMRPSCRK